MPCVHLPVSAVDPPVLSVRPRQQFYSVGATLTITSSSRPAAHRHVWLDSVTGERRSGARLVISADMAGVNNFTCLAFNRIFGVEHNGSIQVHFEVSETVDMKLQRGEK